MRNTRIIACVCFVTILLSLPVISLCQTKKKHPSLKDSLDAAFDLSNYIIESHGFVPVPIIITEPSLGGFGGGIIPIFITPRPPYVDSVKNKLVRTPVAPNLTGGLGAYTVNNTWLVDVFKSGTFIKSRIKYLANIGYGSINMSFYKTVGQQGEKEFQFNLKGIPIALQATKRIGFSHWYTGLKYLLLKSDVQYVGDPLLPPSFVKPREYSSLVSTLGAIIELDNRDNIFTPDNGQKIHLDVQCSDNIFGSDYDYWRMNYYMYLYRKLTPWLTGGWRIDGQQSFGDAPFFLLPFIDMRGIPSERYSGNADILTEIETRWDISRRWSIMLFGGTGKAFDDWKDFGSAEWVYSYGTGFRYLLARKFKLRVGIDIAKGPPGSSGYYIVFGSNWLK